MSRKEINEVYSDFKNLIQNNFNEVNFKEKDDFLITVNNEDIDFKVLYNNMILNNIINDEKVYHAYMSAYLENLLSENIFNREDLSIDNIKHLIYPRIYNSVNKREESSYLWSEFVNDTHILYMYDDSKSQFVRSIPLSVLEKCNITEYDIDNIARKNISKLSMFPDFMEMMESSNIDEGDFSFLYLRYQDCYGASRVLSEKFYHYIMSTKMFKGNTFLFIIPNRNDILCFPDYNDNSLVESKYPIFNEMVKKSPYPITDKIFRASKDGISAF